MLFHTLEFGLLLAVVWPAYWLLRRLHIQNWLLVASSYFFYGWWEWRYVPILLFSTVVDYAIGRAIEAAPNDPRKRKILVALSCTTNLGLLGFFKYWDFFASTTNGVGAWLGFGGLLPELHILLPIGISFYTFQSMAYTIDVYRGHFGAWKSFPEFAAYISFFPQLVAGPIERPENLLRAMGTPRRASWAAIEEGVFLFAKGWLLKSIADVLGDVSDPTFAEPSGAPAWQLTWAMYAFTFQVYCDFLGYSQMARGVARLFGFRLMENFRAPFFAPNVRQLWARWHISLTSWLRDYLFASLRGLRGGRARAVANLMITFLLSGLWHGAAWNFVAWGGALGVAVAVQYLVLDPSVARRRRYLAERPLRRALWTTLGTLFTFHIFAVTIVLFRSQATDSASAFGNALHHIAGMTRISPSSWEAPPFAMWVIAIPVVFDLLLLRYRTSHWSSGWHWSLRGTVIGAMALAGYILGAGDSNAFIYFQF